MTAWFIVLLRKTQFSSFLAHCGVVARYVLGFQDNSAYEVNLSYMYFFKGLGRKYFIIRPNSQHKKCTICSFQLYCINFGHLATVDIPFRNKSTGLESIKKSSTLNLEGEGRNHTCAVSDVPSRAELSSLIDSSPGLVTCCTRTLWGVVTWHLYFACHAAWLDNSRNMQENITTMQHQAGRRPETVVTFLALKKAENLYNIQACRMRMQRYMSGFWEHKVYLAQKPDIYSL